MATDQTIDDYIEAMVIVHCGISDSRTKHIFKQQLQVLVEMSKAEQRHEMDMETYFDNSGFPRGVVH